MCLNRASPVPLYHQLMEKIREKIESGKWPPNFPVPSERQLCRIYQVSRGTVKQALSHLMYEGLIYQKAGKGTFVAKPKLVLSKFDAFAKYIQQRGLKPSFELIMNIKIVPDDPVKTILRLGKNEKVYKIVRLLLGNGEPFVLATDYCPERLVPNLERENLGEISMWDILVNNYHIPIVEAEEIIEPHLADTFEAEKLKVSRNFPTLLIKRTVYTTNAPFYVEKSVVRGDRCSYKVKYKYGKLDFYHQDSSVQIEFLRN